MVEKWRKIHLAARLSRRSISNLKNESSAEDDAWQVGLMTQPLSVAQQGTSQLVPLSRCWKVRRKTRVAS